MPRHSQLPPPESEYIEETAEGSFTSTAADEGEKADAVADFKPVKAVAIVLAEKSQVMTSLERMSVSQAWDPQSEREGVTPPPPPRGINKDPPELTA